MKPAPLIYDPPADEGLNILHRDEDLLVLSKPSGLLSVPGRDPAYADCLELRAKTAFPQALLIHRLDRGTSGVFVMAMNPRAQASLGKQFERRRTHKTYIALVAGQPEHESGHIDLPIVCDWPSRPLQKICHETGREAQTDWEVLERMGDIARLRLRPRTGRSHQLRLHLKELGHPILGDTLYAPPETASVAPRLMLHAQSLTLHHPSDGQLVSYTDPCPF